MGNFSTYWSKRTTMEKVFMIIIIIGFILGTILLIQKSLYKYRYFKAIEKEYKIASDSIVSLNLKLKTLSKAQKDNTDNANKKSKDVKDKLKKDEKTIDDRDVSDAELDEFLARYSK